MWGPLARLMDRGVAYWAARRYGPFFGDTTDADFRDSLYDRLRARLKHEARLSPIPDGRTKSANGQGRKARPSYSQTIEIDRGGEIARTTCNVFLRGYEGERLIIYHHGLGEIPNELSFRRLLLADRKDHLPADLICYHATAHRRPSDIHRIMSTMGGFLTLVGDGMMAVRALARLYRRRYRHVVLVGSSLGGVVGTVEAALSASYDLNIAMIAHLDLVHCITETGFRRMVDEGFLERCPLDLMQIGTEADRILRDAQARLVMINGMHDDYFRIDLAREFVERFPRIRYYEIPQGHISACMAGKTVRRTIRDAMRQERGKGGQATFLQ